MVKVYTKRSILQDYTETIIIQTKHACANVKQRSRGDLLVFLILAENDFVRS